MQDNEVKIGMKVVPHSKTNRWSDLDESYHWKLAKVNKQPYLYVAGYCEEEEAWRLSFYGDSDFGDYFIASDFEPYVEPDELPEDEEPVTSVLIPDVPLFTVPSFIVTDSFYIDDFRFVVEGPFVFNSGVELDETIEQLKYIYRKQVPSNDVLIYNSESLKQYDPTC